MHLYSRDQAQPLGFWGGIISSAISAGTSLATASINKSIASKQANVEASRIALEEKMAELEAVKYRNQQAIVKAQLVSEEIRAAGGVENVPVFRDAINALKTVLLLQQRIAQARDPAERANLEIQLQRAKAVRNVARDAAFAAGYEVAFKTAAARLRASPSDIGGAGGGINLTALAIPAGILLAVLLLRR